MKPKQSKKIIPIIIMLVLVVCAAICAALALRVLTDEGKKSDAMTALQSATIAGGQSTETVDTEAFQELGIEIPEKNLDFAQMKKLNADIYAWIYVPGTSVDYPVLQHPTDDSYYLEHNLDGSAGLPGCIYSELLNGISFADSNTVLYGHNMRNGSMFATLHRFADRDFFDKNRYIYIYTPTFQYVYEIFAAYTYSDVHLLKGIDISSEENFAQYLEDIYAQRGLNDNFAEDIQVMGKDKILTLSTCTSDDRKRYLVQGVLLNGREKRIAEGN